MSREVQGTNSLTSWRKRQAAEKRLKMLELEYYRLYATTEERDGREFVVVRIPDRYDTVERVEPAVVLRRPNRRKET